MDIRWNEQWLEDSHQQNARLHIAHHSSNSGSAELSNVIFDFSGVLYDNSSWRRWLIQQLHRIGVHTHFDPFYRLWECDFLSKLKDGEECWRSLEKYLLAIGLKSGQAFELALAVKSRCDQTMRQLRPFPGVAKTLHLLTAKNVQMDVICSCHWSEEEVQSRLQRMGLQRFFQSVNCLSKTEHRDIAKLLEDVSSRSGPSSGQTAVVARTPRPLEAAHNLGHIPIAFNQTNDCVASMHLDRIDDLLSLPTHSASNRRLAG
jgi:phosphoglycolate phosphatase-like HAD superfamily hydrolase